MPTAYEELLLKTKPEVIETRERYETVLRRVADLTRAGRHRTPEETKLFRLLSLLIQDYDRRHALPPDEATPAERLEYLLESLPAQPCQRSTQWQTPDQRRPSPQTRPDVPPQPRLLRLNRVKRCGSPSPGSRVGGIRKTDVSSRNVANKLLSAACVGFILHTSQLAPSYRCGPQKPRPQRNGYPRSSAD